MIINSVTGTVEPWMVSLLIISLGSLLTSATTLPFGVSISTSYPLTMSPEMTPLSTLPLLLMIRTGPFSISLCLAISSSLVLER